jgi:hypothetical protein
LIPGFERDGLQAIGMSRPISAALQAAEKLDVEGS